MLPPKGGRPGTDWREAVEGSLSYPGVGKLTGSRLPVKALDGYNPRFFCVSPVKSVFRGFGGLLEVVVGFGFRTSGDGSDCRLRMRQPLRDKVTGHEGACECEADLRRL